MLGSLTHYSQFYPFRVNILLTLLVKSKGDISYKGKTFWMTSDLDSDRLKLQVVLIFIHL